MRIPTPKYTNYTYNGEPVINCDKTVDIPYDYDGYLGVPITCFDKFEFGGLVPGMQILACEVDMISGGVNFYRLVELLKDKNTTLPSGRKTYARLILETLELGSTD